MLDPLLTPADVKRLCQCDTRLAFAKMREAGAVPFGRSLRISEEKFLKWLDVNGCKVSSNATASGTYGLIRSRDAKKARGAETKKPLSCGEQNENDLPPIPRCRQPRQLPSANG